MQVEIDEIGVKKILEAEFFVANSLSWDGHVFFAPLDEKGGLNQRWMVLDDDFRGNKDGYVTVYTTEEMKLLYCSVKGFGGKPTKAYEDVGRHFLVRSGKLRMKIREGCPGCRRFWGGDCSEGQCSKCHRCYACCGKESVPFSCASGYAKKEEQRRYARRRR